MSDLKIVPGKRHPIKDETERCAECGAVLPDEEDYGGVLCTNCRPPKLNLGHSIKVR